MAFWILDQWAGGELDYSSLGFRATTNDVLEAVSAPDARWSSTGSGPETVDRYALGVDPSYVEPTDGHLLAWSDAQNRYVPTAPVTATDAGTAANIANVASATRAALDPATAANVNDTDSETRTALNALYASVSDSDGNPLTGQRARFVVDDAGWITDFIVEGI